MVAGETLRFIEKHKPNVGQVEDIQHELIEFIEERKRIGPSQPQSFSPPMETSEGSGINEEVARCAGNREEYLAWLKKRAIPWKESSPGLIPEEAEDQSHTCPLNPFGAPLCGGADVEIKSTAGFLRVELRTTILSS